MAVKRCEANIDVVKAAEIRIKNVFGNGLPVFFSFSGGKDSLCVAQLMVNLANRGEIDMKQLTVQFIDEEAIFPCMEDMTKKWRAIQKLNLLQKFNIVLRHIEQKAGRGSATSPFCICRNKMMEGRGVHWQGQEVPTALKLRKCIRTG